MSDESSLALLLIGPAGGTGLYWMLYRYYRNTDKSHAFEKETAVVAKPVTGTDEKTGKVEGVRNNRIPGDNVRAYRERVERIPNFDTKTGAPRRPGDA
jgi:hypothetical protein